MADRTVLKNALINGVITDVTVEGGKITNIGKTEAADSYIDIKGNILLPGLVDIHSHGCVGHDTMDALPEEMAEMRRFLKNNGTTSWLPTTMTATMEDIDRVTSRVLTDIGNDGANVIGFHMEGPYINVKYKGAQNEDFIKAPSVSEFKKLKNIKILTLAPELEGSEETIRYCAENGISVALGHTDCNFECAEKAFEAGANCLTHTFNAMPPLLHRAPGPIGAAMLAGAYAQVICDGKHIHKAAVNALYRMFGADRMVLISDSMHATGLGDGEYIFGGQKVVVKDGTARTLDGALAGSTSTLFFCVKKAIEFGISAEDAFKMASETPANMLGLKKGRIALGYDAEFIVLGKDYELIDTLIFH